MNRVNDTTMTTPDTAPLLDPGEARLDATPAAVRILEATETRLQTVLAQGAGQGAQSDTLTNASRHLCIGRGAKGARPGDLMI